MESLVVIGALSRLIGRIMDRYNRARRHSTCEMHSPVDYEHLLAARAWTEQAAA